MITLLENSQTKEKGTLNFVDDRGKVVGLNPYPDGKRIKYSVRNGMGHLIADDQLDPLEYILVGMHARFGNDVSFAKESDGDEITAMSFSVFMDRDPKHVFSFHVEGTGGEYYCEDLGLLKQDLLDLFSPQRIQDAKAKAVSLSRAFPMPSRGDREPVCENGFDQPRLLGSKTFFDDRGWFHPMRAPFPIVQANVSESRRGVIRGMHWQKGIFSQKKMVSVLTGSIRDVVMDLRPSSPTFGRVSSFLLSMNDGRSLYVPSGFAHGFQALENGTRIMYLVDRDWSPENERSMNARSEVFAEAGFDFSIATLSDKDGNAPTFDEIGRSEYPD